MQAAAGVCISEKVADVKNMKRYLWGILVTALLTAALLAVLHIPLPGAETVMLWLAEAGGAAFEGKADVAAEKEADSAKTLAEMENGQDHVVYQSEKPAENTDDGLGENESVQKAPEKEADYAENASGQEADHMGNAGGEETDRAESASGQEPLFQTVTEDYFSDALFIGDSRTVGMQQSGLLDNAAYYAKTGIGIGAILQERIVSENGVSYTVKEALARHAFRKVYIMIGINDMSAGDVAWYTQQYEEILDAVRSTQPQAIIYIQGNIPMSYGKQEPGGALTNENLRLRNEAARALADNETVFYLDIQDIYADENGHLAQAYTSDGLHVKSEYYGEWVDYLKTHAVVRS